MRKESDWYRKKKKEKNSKDVLNMVKDTNLQIEKVCQTLNKINSKNTHSIIKLLKTKNKEKILKAVKENQHTTYRENSNPIRNDGS